MTETDEQTQSKLETSVDDLRVEPLIRDLLCHTKGSRLLEERDAEAFRELGPNISERLFAELTAEETQSEHGDLEQIDRDESPSLWRGTGGADIENTSMDPGAKAMVQTIDNDLDSTQGAPVADDQREFSTGPMLPGAMDSGIDRLDERVKTMIRQRQIGRDGYVLGRLLGAGGQGSVYLTRYGGADGFHVRAALKIFSPQGYRSVAEYETAMRRIARISRRVAQERSPNLVDVCRFEKRHGVRMMLMELLNGYDLRRLLNPRMHEHLRRRVPELANEELWTEFNKVLVTAGPEQPRMQPGAAVMLIRNCLTGLDALHEMDVIHFDIKPSNIMVTRGGYAKIIDLGSAVDRNDPGDWSERIYTPAYAAPEVLERKQWTRRSDLASLGYVLIELMTGRRLFKPAKGATKPLDRRELLQRKHELPGRLRGLLPEESDLLLEFCKKMIAPNPDERFLSAREAELDKRCGAAAFHAQLIRGELDAIWTFNIRMWIKTIKNIEQHDVMTRNRKQR